jgi:hypothetical protein
LPSASSAPSISPTATKAKPPVVSWWGLVPVVLYMLLVLVFGWPVKGNHPNTAGYTVGYMMGGCITGIALPLLPAWIAYRLFRRSSLAGTLVFTLGICFFSLVLLVRFAVDRIKSLQPQMSTVPAATVPVITSFGDFRFEIPAGWQMLEPEMGKTKASLLRIRPNSQLPEGLLKVDVGKPVGPNALKTAQTLAGADGRVLPDRISLDGVEAIRVETPSKDFSRPHLAAVAIRDGRLYLVMAAAENGSDITDAFDHVVKTWHWNEMPRSGEK